MDKGFHGDTVISMAATRVPPGVRTSQPEGHTLEITHNGQKRNICAFCSMDKSQRHGIELKKTKQGEQHNIRVIARRDRNRHGENLSDWNPN